MQIPAEGIAILKSPSRYVLLEHRWNGVHYDFMLEHEGWLLTWKLMEPLRSGDQLVIDLPRHRLAYLEYEGPVSNDRGSVTRIASGVYHGTINHHSDFTLQLTGTLNGSLHLMRLHDSEWKLIWNANEAQ